MGRQHLANRRRIGPGDLTYDPELNTLYWGVGNPSPDFNGEVRKGG